MHARRGSGPVVFLSWFNSCDCVAVMVTWKHDCEPVLEWFLTSCVQSRRAHRTTADAARYLSGCNCWLLWKRSSSRLILWSYLMIELLFQESSSLNIKLNVVLSSVTFTPSSEGRAASGVGYRPENYSLTQQWFNLRWMSDESKILMWLNNVIIWILNAGDQLVTSFLGPHWCSAGKSGPWIWFATWPDPWDRTWTLPDLQNTTDESDYDEMYNNFIWTESFLACG